MNSLGIGNPFYVLRKGEKPVLEVGVVKSKTQPRAKFPTQTPNIMAGVQMQQVIDLVATINDIFHIFNITTANNKKCRFNIVFFQNVDNFERIFARAIVKS